MTDLNEKALDAAMNAISYVCQTKDVADAIRAYLASATPPDVAGIDDMLDRFERAAFASTANLPRGKEARARESKSRSLEYNAARDAIATALRLSAGGGWRTMESAPKDGSVVLAYRPDVGVFTAHYVEEDAHLSSFASPPEGDCYWFATNGDDLTGDMFTHWQPLPLPPVSPTVEAGHVE